ncbi:AraC family transcriptional regulator [Actinomadura sp. NBRC 104412]|uniref:AraC family transcriptional regulator n=1 Tax=Actinomadura sp. NBRC 104412 TaxID=3032203 RepID=UPI0024A3AEC3|nr:AraC family transcriptional regulator [Actinomadura sp. NBRC 104412]GLZ08775.1 AraC family transcriptional regulator [Actinomadura sp. NBRC 104412]
MTARIGRRHYAPHAHEEYAIGVCTDGLETIRYRGEYHHSGPGSVVVLEPGEPHTGGPADERGFAYRVLYPVPELLEDALPSRGEGALPHFRDGIIDDGRLARRLWTAHRVLSRPDGDPLAGETMLLSVLDALVRRHAERPSRPHRAAMRGSGSEAAWIARTVSSRLADELVAPPALGELAAEMGVSRYRVVRGFSEVMGMPPYAWLAQHRVTRARSLLDAGLRPAEVATLVGFADQAHLTRWFRRVIGVTPGQYRNSVQDGARPGPRD